MKIGDALIPKERGGDGGAGGCKKSREKGVRRRKLSIPCIFQTHKTTTNRRVCVHLEAADGVPGAETVQQTYTGGSG